MVSYLLQVNCYTEDDARAIVSGYHLLGWSHYEFLLCIVDEFDEMVQKLTEFLDHGAEAKGVELKTSGQLQKEIEENSRVYLTFVNVWLAWRKEELGLFIHFWISISIEKYICSDSGPVFMTLFRSLLSRLYPQYFSDEFLTSSTDLALIDFGESSLLTNF